MDESTIEYWTPDEYFIGLCSEAEVGQVKPALVEARRLAQRATSRAMKALVDVAEQSDDLQAKVKAAQVLLDRGWGKAEQHTTSVVQKLDNMPWVSAQRLAYRLTPQTVDLDSPSDAMPKEPARAQELEPWKEVPERGVLLRPVKP